MARSSLDASVPSIVVISPPSGIGEVTAVKTAQMGSSVRWFVVNSQSSNQKVLLAQESLECINAAGGNIELAGADAASLLLPADDPASATSAVSTWCGSADAIVCTLDGVEAIEAKGMAKEEKTREWKDAIKVAAEVASKGIAGARISVISAFDDEESNREEAGGLPVVGNLLRMGKTNIPESLVTALASQSKTVTTLRHGSLFGIPESSPDFSPFVGGPRRQPELCEEYSMRAVRVDPTLSVAGNVMMGSSTRSSRHAVGEAAALMALGKVPFKAGSDICVSSLLGADRLDESSWEAEFQRVEKMLNQGVAAQLFSAEFSSVPDVERLADWLATKWAPAILRTYDIATIRSGARPVYASRSGDGRVEIVWQQLVNFESVTVGKLYIQVSDTGLVAVRGAGDAQRGFGSVSKTPLAGEDVLVRRLAEASSQAVEKGLAVKKVRG